MDVQALDSSTRRGRAVAESATPVEELELWQRFHAAVEELPSEEREVVGLAFYHGWTQAQIGELIGVDERTIRRRWHRACLRLAEQLDGRLPGPEDGGT
jgi:RNA polymerase sigma factor (sigma-70 family)